MGYYTAILMNSGRKDTETPFGYYKDRSGISIGEPNFVSLILVIKCYIIIVDTNCLIHKFFH